MTEHPTGEGKVYCAAVMDAHSRLIVGWSIAEHMRTELVTDALGMAIIRHGRTDTPLRRARSCTPTTALSTLLGRSGSVCVPPAWSPRWAPLVIATTTR